MCSYKRIVVLIANFGPLPTVFILLLYLLDGGQRSSVPMNPTSSAFHQPATVYLRGAENRPTHGTTAKYFPPWPGHCEHSLQPRKGEYPRLVRDFFSVVQESRLGMHYRPWNQEQSRYHVFNDEILYFWPCNSVFFLNQVEYNASARLYICNITAWRGIGYKW